MDFGSELFWIVMVVVYLVFQVLGARKKKQHQRKQRPSPQPREPLSSSSEEEVELDEALREIRRALGFPDDQPEEPRREKTTPIPTDDAWISPEAERAPERQAQTLPEPRAEPAPTPVERSPKRPSPRKESPKPTPGLGELGKIRRPERPGRKVGGAISAADERPKIPRGPTYEKLDKPPSEVLAPRESLLPPTPTPKGSGLSLVATRLRNSSSARQAFLMKEILDPPRALRNRR